MNKNTAKIKSGIRELADKDNEIISGTFVAGSFSSISNTISVLPSSGGLPIEGVMLNTITGSTNGFIIYPADGSNVVIGTIDGPGEWILLRAADLVKAAITIGTVVYEIDNTQVSIVNGALTLNVGNTVFKMNTATDGLYALLHDLISAITMLTVPTTGGPSGVPINVLAFNALLTRLESLLAG